MLSCGFSLQVTGNPRLVKDLQTSLGVQHAAKPRQDAIDPAQAARSGSSWPEDHPLIIWSGYHDERAQKSKARQEESGHDTERKEGCEEVQEGIQGFPGQ